MKHDCPYCECDKHPAPVYPVTCSDCGVTYGPGGQVPTHRPGSEACKRLGERLSIAFEAAGLNAANAPVKPDFPIVYPENHPYRQHEKWLNDACQKWVDGRVCGLPRRMHPPDVTGTIQP